jgi:hypothetical protein
MPDDQRVQSIREAVGVFDHADYLQDAIDELLSSGFDRAELSLLASEHTLREKLGERYRTVAALADDPDVPRSAYVSPEAIGGAESGLIGGLVYIGATAAIGGIVASGGTLIAVITAAALAGGAGGLIGSVLARWVGEHHAHHLQQQLEHGGLLLWVRTWNAEDERRAVEILGRHGATDVHVHALPVSAP